MSRKLVNIRINNAGLCVEGWVDTGVCDPMASRPIYTMFEGGVVIPGAVITPAGACPKEVVVSPGVPVPVVATGNDCTGLPVTAVGVQGQLVQTVPHPSAVQLVKICGDKPRFDREMVTLCTPAGTKVIVQNVTPEDAPLGTAPVFEAWNLNGTAYTGAVSALVDCGVDKVNTEHTDYCAGGSNFTRVDGLAEDTGLPVWTIWLDDAGVPVAAPVGAVKGTCEVCQPKPCCPRTTFYNAGAAITSANYSAFAFAPYPDIGAVFTGAISAANLYIHAFQNNNTGDVYGTTGVLFANPTTPVLWANAQPALNAYLVAVGLPAGSVVLGTDAAGQPLVAYNTASVHSSDIAWWCGNTNEPDKYSNKATTETRIDVEQFSSVAGNCREIKVVDTLQCDGTYTTQGFELNNTAIVGFDPTKVVASCPVAQKPDLIYLQTNDAVLSVSDIVAATLATKIVSITVKQVSGVGTVSADSGSGVALDPGETWSWGNNESLGSSLLTMNANGGRQRITAIYTI